MIALIRNDFFENFDARAAWVWAVLFLAGTAAGLVIRKNGARLAAVLGSLALVGICDVLAALPTPKKLAGDGYAVTQEAGLIGASFLVPLAAGVWMGVLIGGICRRFFRRS